jgi:hypothetical protein
MKRLLTCLLFAAVLPIGGCYAEVTPGPAYYNAPPPPVVYGRTYVWHSYGRPPPPR